MPRSRTNHCRRSHHHKNHLRLHSKEDDEPSLRVGVVNHDGLCSSSRHQPLGPLFVLTSSTTTASVGARVVNHQDLYSCSRRQRQPTQPLFVREKGQVPTFVTMVIFRCNVCFFFIWLEWMLLVMIPKFVLLFFWLRSVTLWDSWFLSLRSVWFLSCAWFFSDF